MSGVRDEIEKLRQVEEAARAGGGKKYIEEQHRLGKLTARERIDHLLDAVTFVEVTLLAQHQCTDFGMEKNRPWGDGVITGYGKVEGRVVFLYAQDSTIMGGSVGLVHGQKIASLIRMARQASAPVIGLIDSAGGRIQEGSGAYSLIFAENVESSGVIPQISAIMGNCAGGESILRRLPISSSWSIRPARCSSPGPWSSKRLRARRLEVRNWEEPEFIAIFPVWLILLARMTWTVWPR